MMPVVAVLEARAFLTSFEPKEDKGPSPFYRLFSPLSGDGLEAEIETIATQVRFRQHKQLGCPNSVAHPF